MAQKRNYLEEHCGDVFGVLAYAPPFLDSNGRTMLPVLAELMRRVGLEIKWSALDRGNYLTALAGKIARLGEVF